MSERQLVRLDFTTRAVGRMLNEVKIRHRLVHNGATLQVD